MSASILDLVASHAGITKTQARQAVTSALRQLHRTAVTREEGVTASLMEARFNFGSEACYHIGGLLEHQRVHCDPELPWAEVLMRFDPDTQKYRALIDYWLAKGGDHEPVDGWREGDDYGSGPA